MGTCFPLGGHGCCQGGRKPANGTIGNAVWFCTQGFCHLKWGCLVSFHIFLSSCQRSKNMESSPLTFELLLLLNSSVFGAKVLFLHWRHSLHHYTKVITLSAFLTQYLCFICLITLLFHFIRLSFDNLEYCSGLFTVPWHQKWIHFKYRIIIIVIVPWFFSSLCEELSYFMKSTFIH